MISIRNYSFGYPDSPVLDNVNLTIAQGKITAIIGANGAGKSTLLKSVSGLIWGEGSIRIKGREVMQMDAHDRVRTISHLAQDLSCDAALNVFEIVLLGMVGSLGTRVEAADIERVHAVLDNFGLAPFAQRNIAELSGGQRQLVFIAQALVREPAVLVFDEPTASLDLCRQYELMNRLQALTRQRGLATLLTLHHLELVAQYADQVVVMHDRGVYAAGAVADVMTETMFRDVFRLETEVFTDSRGTIRVLPIAPCAGATRGAGMQASEARQMDMAA